MTTTLTETAPPQAVAQPTPPPPPATIADSGLNPEVLAQLLLKTLIAGEASGSRSRARFSISSAIWRPGTPSRMSGSCT